MLRSVIVCPDQDLSERLYNAVLGTRRVGVVRRLEHYPNALDLARFLRATGPEVVFLGAEQRKQALEVAGQIEQHAPGTQIIAVSRTLDSQALLECMRAGIREFLSPPFEAAALQEALARVEAQIEQRPPAIQTTDAVFAFLPAKAGVGTTTIAVNTAIAMSELVDEKVLLMDLDLNCGLIGFMLLIENQFSILDAAENALEMDEHLWPKIVSSLQNLDILPVGKLSPGFRIENTQIRHLLDYARRNYSAVCVDLSGMMEKYSIEILHEAKRVFLVCTPELPALHLAREKLKFLRSQDLESRVSILLNRGQKRMQIPLDEMEKLFGLPVQMAFPNDYSGVHKALTAGKQVEATSELGRRYRELAETMIVRRTPATQPESELKKKVGGFMGLGLLRQGPK